MKREREGGWESAASASMESTYGHELTATGSPEGLETLKMAAGVAKSVGWMPPTYTLDEENKPRFDRIHRFE